MSNDSASRRAWVKNVAIIFLVILLLLTFFSNTIMNYSLPEVSAQYTSSGTLSTAIKASGTVKANASYNVIYEADVAETENGVSQTRKVLSVYVKEGQTVEKGDPILELKGGASEQLKAAQDEYDKLKREYELGLLSDNVSSLESNRDISDDQKSLANAKEELAKLQKTYNELLSGVDTTTILEGQIESLEETIEELTEQQKELGTKISDIESIISGAESKLEKDYLSNETNAEKLVNARDEYYALAEKYETLKKETEFYKERLDELSGISGDVSEANKLTTELETLKETERSLRKTIDRYWEDKEDALQDIIDSEKSTEDEIATAKSDLALLKAYGVRYFYHNDSANLTSDKTFNRKMQDYAEELIDLEEQIEELEDKLDVIGMPKVDDLIDYTVDYDLASAQKDYDNSAEALKSIETEYTNAKSKYESLLIVDEYTTVLDSYKDEEKTVESLMKQYNKELESLKKQLSDASSTLTTDELAEKIKAQQDSIDSLETTLKINQAKVEQSTTSTKLNREDQKKQLEELEKQIEVYENAPETTQITAPVSGKITSVNFTAGESVTSGNTVAAIEIADSGYIVEISMAADQAKKIQVGTPCSIVNSWWYSNITASVVSIRSDASSQGKNRIITITVTGDVTEGQSLTFSIGDKSQSYDSVLPNSAIREDNDGKFVLVVESKKTPLNVRYTVKRVDIEVLASDDTQSAVSGLYGSEFVVTNSTSPITDGQQVRLAEK